MSNVMRYIKRTSQYIDYCEAIIFPNGNVEDAIPSHLYKLISISNKTKEELCELIPQFADSVSWMIDYTGCICVWYDFAKSPKSITTEQERSLSLLQRCKRISDNYTIISTMELEKCKLLESMANNDISPDCLIAKLKKLQPKKYLLTGGKLTCVNQ